MDMTNTQLQQLVNAAQVGRTVNNVTHDINNILGAILLYAELLHMDASDDQAKAHLSEIITSVQKSSSLLEHITTVSRRPSRQEPPSSSLPDTLNAVECLFQYEIKRAGIHWSLEHDESIENVPIDQPVLQRILMHLVANAVECSYEEEENRIVVRVERKTDSVSVAVWNSAPSIADEVVEMMFTPFFTTKGDTHAGMGLPTARALVKEYDGDLSYTAEAGFQFTLPCVP